MDADIPDSRNKAVPALSENFHREVPNTALAEFIRPGRPGYGLGEPSVSIWLEFTKYSLACLPSVGCVHLWLNHY
jgi:hypothetical protein